MVTKNKQTGNKATANCQMEMLKQADNLENTILKELNKSKKSAIKDPTVDSEAALEAALVVGLSTNEKIRKAEDKLRKQVIEKKCKDLAPAAVPNVFSGDCSDLDLGDVVECVIDRTRCATCRKYNRFDDLELDCDVIDDADGGNASCPLLP
ncbi:unnamed protein product [marine sediment metagenome]|uniref:Uncharacterized protein n=1 Tax=marine sediment metagenome TaxID=412755 RepID=X0TDN2_9ZZZZ